MFQLSFNNFLHLFHEITFVIILKQLFAAGSVNVSIDIHYTFPVTISLAIFFQKQ